MTPTVVLDLAEHPRPGGTVGEALDRGLALLPALGQIPDQLDRIARQLTSLDDQATRQGHAIEDLHQKVDDQRHALSDLCDRDALLAQASARQAQLTDRHYRDHVVCPIARQIIPLVDLADDVLRASPAEARGDSADSLARSIRDAAIESLARVGVELLPVPCGSPFDPKYMRPVRSEATTTRSQDRRVASQVRAGFLIDEQVLRPAAVVVFRFQATESVTHSNEGELQ